MRAARLLALLSGLALAAGAAPGRADEAMPAMPRFVDETARSGLGGTYAGDWTYMVGGGVSSFDCNDDLKPDVLLPGGEGKARFYRNVSPRGGSLAFVETPAGLELAGVTGSYPLDIDSDGILDLVLLRVGENVAMRGLGGCRFERANERWHFDGGDAWSAAFAATFERGARFPTLAIGNYIDRKEEMFPWGSCTPNWLHRPAATGDGFASPLPLSPSFCTLSMLFTDWNRSGTPSLRVSNDREYYKGGEEQLWQLRPGEAPALYGEADGWKFLRIWGMGIASADLDRDGFPDYFLTSMADSKLQVLASPGPQAKPAYKDIAFARGVTAHRPYAFGDIRPSTGWHPEFEDIDNDGRLDLFVAKGNVAEMPDFAARDPNNLLMQGADGRFSEMGLLAGVASTRVARGATLTDFNLDGLVDLLVVNRWTGPELWRNVTPRAGGFVAVRLEQDGVNRDAVGAVLEVRRGASVERREITVGGGHAGGKTGFWHVGLGAEAAADLRVVWPDGEAGPFERLPAGSFYRLRRGMAAETVALP